ncbi:MAG: hypothetical protein AAGG75_07880 [Bacteroidota bacterium]
MRITIPMIILSLLLTKPVFAQPSTDYMGLLKQLEVSIKAGTKKSLRDLGSLVDHPKVGQQARQLLRNNILLNPTDFDLNKPYKSQDFLQFYYNNAEQLSYSELLNTFFLTSLEKWEVKYKSRQLEAQSKDKQLQLRSHIQQANKLLGNNQPKELSKVLKKIALLERYEGHQYMLELLANKQFKKIRPKARGRMDYIIAEALTNYPYLESTQALLQLLHNKLISAEQAAPLLAKVTNIKLPKPGNAEQLEQRYLHYIDSLGTLETMQAYGYEQHFSFRMSFFEFAVDYFGKVLNLSYNYPWLQHNALRDLTETYHARSLFYLSTQIYKYWHSDPRMVNQYLKRLQEMTRLDIGLYNAAGELTYDYQAGDEETLRLNCLIYWAKHYRDYEWDPHNAYYTNKYTAEEISQNYEKLFRRLNSKNDSVALQSFLKLTEGDPIEVSELAEKYRQLLRTYNRNLPSFKHQYLEQLAQLTDYCRKNGFSYKISPKLQPVVDQLLHTSSLSQRYQLENQMIAEMSLSDVTALEYLSCIYEGKATFVFSVGRILDRFYSAHWEQIVNSDTELLLYLKKAEIFEGIGVFGSCNNYLVKFDLQDKQMQSRLLELGKIETDEGILNQLSRLIIEEEEDEAMAYIDISNFLDDPNGFTKRDINILPPPQPGDLRKIIKGIKGAEEIASVKQFFHYLRLHPSIDLVPLLFSLADDKRIVTQRRGVIIYVSDLIVPSLEDIYNYHFAPDDERKPFATQKWKAKWAADGKQYKDWIRIFFEEKLDSLLMSPTIAIEDINLITESPHYNEDYKEVCLKALTKVRPFKDIRKLNIKPKLNALEDLQYFEDFFFSYKELDDIPKLFEIPTEHVETILAYLERKSAEFSHTERGSFYNNLFRSPWFTNYINSGKATIATANRIKDILNSYLEESDYLSEFEEQTTNLHIAQIENIGRKLEDKLMAAFHMSADEGSRAKILESIIASVSYAEIGTVVELLYQMNSATAEQSLAFLHKDFGIPLFEFDDNRRMQELIALHDSLSEKDFYIHYLRGFGVDFLDKKGQLDLQKIYDILQYDIITPFVSRTGGKRDYFTYGIIKLLEIKFGTRLDFHQKLNENQTFYTFSSAKRATAWRDFLRQKKHIKTRNQNPPSFSQVRKDD